MNYIQFLLLMDLRRQGANGISQRRGRYRLDESSPSHVGWTEVKLEDPVGT